jgi:hypothetical protein
MLSPVISLLIVLALVTVPLALIARLSLTVLARMLGVTSQSEVATRAEFARIREQLLATAGDGEGPAEKDVPRQQPPEPDVLQWSRCPACAASVPSAASICLQCGAGLNVQR